VVPGFLSEREAHFLALAAACGPAEGVILEIGSFKGRATVALASVAARYGLGRVVSVDPHTAPSVTDPDLRGNASSYDDFTSALAAAGLSEQVEVHRTFSRELAKRWSHPIRLLWIDGDHTYAGAKEDFGLFRSYLAEGAIVALHDVLHEFEGPVRVFAEDLLGSDDFGPAGVCGSIGWAQYRPRDASRFRAARLSLAGRTARLVPFVKRGKPSGFRKLSYKFRRALIPRGPVVPVVWADRVSLDRSRRETGVGQEAHPGR
jgi:hypothetical protein